MTPGLLPSLAYAGASAPVTGGIINVVASLLLILGLFVLAAWLVKRYLPRVGKPGPVKIIGSAMLGAREKLVVVEVENTWLLLGVGAGQIRTLHTLPKPVAQTEPT